MLVKGAPSYTKSWGVSNMVLYGCPDYSVHCIGIVNHKGNTAVTPGILLKAQCKTDISITNVLDITQLCNKSSMCTSCYILTYLDHRCPPHECIEDIFPGMSDLSAYSSDTTLDHNSLGLLMYFCALFGPYNLHRKNSFSFIQNWFPSETQAV